MKKYIRLAWVVGLASLISACATSNTAATAEKPQAVPKYSAVDSMLRYPDGDKFKPLRLGTRGQTAKVTAAKTFQFIFGGNTVGFTKDQLIGVEITDIKNKERTQNPADLVFAKVQADFQQMAKTDPSLNEKKFMTKLVVEPDTPLWKLVYDKLSGDKDNNHYLAFGMKISRASTGTVKGLFGSKETHFFITQNCNYKSEIFPLETWIADDYQKVAELRQEAVDSCVKQLSAGYSKFTTQTQ